MHQSALTLIKGTLWTETLQTHLLGVPALQLTSVSHKAHAHVVFVYDLIYFTCLQNKVVLINAHMQLMIHVLLAICWPLMWALCILLPYAMDYKVYWTWQTRLQRTNTWCKCSFGSVLQSWTSVLTLGSQWSVLGVCSPVLTEGSSLRLPLECVSFSLPFKWEP